MSNTIAFCICRPFSVTIIQISILKFCPYFSSRTENSPSILSTHITTPAFFEVIQSTFLTKVMFALCNNRVNKGFPADETLEWEMFIITWDLPVLIRVITSLGCLNLKLPPQLVVGAIVKEFAAVCYKRKSNIIICYTSVLKYRMVRR